MLSWSVIGRLRALRHLQQHCILDKTEASKPSPEFGSPSSSRPIVLCADLHIEQHQWNRMYNGSTSSSFKFNHMLKLTGLCSYGANVIFCSCLRVTGVWLTTCIGGAPNSCWVSCSSGVCWGFYVFRAVRASISFIKHRQRY